MITEQKLKGLVYYNGGKLYWKISKQRINKDSEIGYIDSKGYRNVVIEGKNYKTHRLVFLYHYGYLPEYVDHIDGNPCNNNIENLRECTKQQNNWNRKKNIKSSSNIKGVSWYKPYNKWRAQIWMDGKKKHLGYFDNIKDAENKLVEIRNELHCEFSNNG